MKSKNKNVYGKMDFVLLSAVLLLVCFGVVMVYSASSYNAQVNYGNEFYYAIKQIIGVALGLIAMFVCAFTDYHFLLKLLQLHL